MLVGLTNHESQLMNKSKSPKEATIYV
jgi:hypothetical protein